MLLVSFAESGRAAVRVLGSLSRFKLVKQDNENEKRRNNKLSITLVRHGSLLSQGLALLQLKYNSLLRHALSLSHSLGFFHIGCAFMSL